MRLERQIGGSQSAALLADPDLRSHIIYPCREEGRVLEVAAFYAASGLANGEAVALITTEAHREGIVGRLNADGFKVERMESDGQLVFLDAETVLPSCTAEGILDSTPFKTTLDTLIKRAKRDVDTGRSTRKVRIFGELVSLLCRKSMDAALQLERLVDEIIKAHSVTVFCAYTLDWQGSTYLPPAILDLHSHTIPA